MKRRLLFIVNIDWFFLSHRLPIAIKALNEGYEVHIATSITDKYDVLRSHGLIVHPLPIGRSSIGFFSELKTFLTFLRVIRKVRPHILHLVTIKPVIFGGICARLAGVPSVVSAISGLGFVFLARGLKASVVRTLVVSLYRLALGKRNLKVICQNPNDCETLVQTAGLSLARVAMIPGSGVDLVNYMVKPLPQGIPLVVMAARLLRDKGVYEFIEAAQLLNQRSVAVRFCLIGEPDHGNPATVTLDDLCAWDRYGCVERLGYRNDIPDLFSKANVVVLPSYYGEGLPKTLVEAAACGRAVVTTDHPGCRDAIEPGKSGLLVPVKDSTALADAIQQLVDNPKLQYSMGRAGRALAEREFAIEKIVNAHLTIYKELDGCA